MTFLGQVEYRYCVSWRTRNKKRVIIRKYAVIYETLAKAEEKVAMLQAKNVLALQLWEVKELESPE